MKVWKWQKEGFICSECLEKTKISQKGVKKELKLCISQFNISKWVSKKITQKENIKLMQN